MRFYTVFQALPYYGLAAILGLALPAQAGITFRIYTSGPQAGEVHIDSPEGHYIYFRQDFDNDIPPKGFCGIRWSADKGELAWYWGDPGRMGNLLYNSMPASELSYMAGHSSCGKQLPESRFHTPSTPNGAAPPGSRMLVVEAPAWSNVTFINHSLTPLPLPRAGMPQEEFDICRRYPGFCEYSPGLNHYMEDPCQNDTYGDLICRVLPGAQSALIRTTDLLSSLGVLNEEIKGYMLYFYNPREVRKLRNSVRNGQDRLGLIQRQFEQLYRAYRSLDAPLERLNSIPFSHYAHTTVLTHLDLLQICLERCHDKLNAIDEAARGRGARPPQQELEQLEVFRRWAHFHLLEAKFWMERQQAWIVPMER